MSYVTVEVDIDLDEIDSEDLLYEIIRRIGRKDFKREELKDLTDALSKLSMDVVVPPKESGELQYQWKVQHILKVINKYSLEQIEKALPEWP